MENKVNEYKSFYKEVKGNEGDKCNYPTRLDTYGCGCANDCSYCLDGDTNILMYDGSIKKLRDVEIGEEIYGVYYSGNNHKYTKSIIMNKWSVSKPSYKITLSNGRELICSSDHQWLTDRGWKYTTGCMSGKDRRPYLTTSNSLVGLSTLTFDTFEETSEYKMGYLSGIIKGDGNLREYHYSGREYRKTDDQYHFRLVLKEEQATVRAKDYLEYFGVDTNWFEFPMVDRTTKESYVVQAIRTYKKDNFDKIEDIIKIKHTPEFLRGFLAGIYDAEGSSQLKIKRIYNTDEEIISTTLEALDLFDFKYTKDNKKKTKNKVLQTIRILGGVSEFVRLFQTVNPSIKRWACLEGITLKNPKGEDLKIVSIEPYKDEQELFDITTSTRNFIANGVVSHNCYAKSLLDFRKLWNPTNPSVADINKIRRKISKLPKGSIVRLGGMTDCFQICEKKHRVTYETIKALNEYGIHYLIVTKCDMVADDEYIEIMDKNLAHIQVTYTCTDDDLYRKLDYEKAPLPSLRRKAIEKLQANGFDVALRLSPYIPEYVDLNVLNSIKCDKIQVEFLRVNTWIKKWFDIDYTDYTVKQSNYLHLPLEKKR